MGSAHSDALAKHVNKLMTDPEWAAIISAVVNDMNSDKWPSAYIDVCLQKWERFPGYDLYDAYAFALFNTRLLSGTLLLYTIQVGDEPRSDKDVEFNNAVMSRLPRPFTGEFYGGLADHDGSVIWTGSVPFQKTIHTPHEGHCLESHDTHTTVECPSQWLPLEVGYTAGSRTLLHLEAERGVARWPYGSDMITLIVNTEPHILDMPYKSRFK